MFKVPGYLSLETELEAKLRKTLRQIILDNFEQARNSRKNISL